jgi:CRP-like cAMP-binding protein
MSAACFQEAGPGKRIRVYRDKEVVFSQGSPANALFYIQSGIVMLTTASKKGNKKAVLALLQQGDLFGECCLAQQTRRTCSATTIGLSTLTRLDKIFFQRELKRNREFADMFIEYLIAQTARFKADLADHFLNFSERRLARILLMHKEFARTSTGAPGIHFTQTALAEMVGTTRGRINRFLNDFRKRGYIRYNGEMVIDAAGLAEFLQG